MRPIHLVLKATKPVLFRNRRLVESLTRRLATRFGIRTYGVAIPDDHVHLALLLPSREAYRKFVRSLCGLLARHFGKGLWKCLPFTRVLSWGKDFRNVLAYLKKNCEEALGLREYEPRKDWYRKFKKPMT
jgi:REP element-mobilizing transposase RayT